MRKELLFKRAALVGLGAVLAGSAVVPEGTKAVLREISDTVVDTTHNVTDWVVHLPSQMSGAENGSEGGMQRELPSQARIFTRQESAIKA